jgi:hypothetical protein
VLLAIFCLKVDAKSRVFGGFLVFGELSAGHLLVRDTCLCGTLACSDYTRRRSRRVTDYYNLNLPSLPLPP